VVLKKNVFINKIRADENVKKPIQFS